MARFATDLTVECVNGKSERWRLVKELVYESDIAGTVTVPVGFETDFASVPRLPVVYMLVGNLAHLPAVVHDYLYRYALVSRKVADKVFLEAMNACGIWAWRRYPMYWGVRLFGGSCYVHG